MIKCNDVTQLLCFQWTCVIQQVLAPLISSCIYLVVQISSLAMVAARTITINAIYFGHFLCENIAKLRGWPIHVAVFMNIAKNRTVGQVGIMFWNIWTFVLKLTLIFESCWKLVVTQEFINLRSNKETVEPVLFRKLA